MVTPRTFIQQAGQRMLAGLASEREQRLREQGRRFPRGTRQPAREVVGRRPPRPTGQLFRTLTAPSRQNPDELYRVEVSELAFVRPSRRATIYQEFEPGEIARMVAPQLRRALRRSPVPRRTGRLRRTVIVTARPNGTVVITQRHYGFFVDEGTVHIRPRRYIERIVGRLQRRLDL